VESLSEFYNFKKLAFYDKEVKPNKKEKVLSWDNDGFKGVGDPSSCVGILIGWLTTQGKYVNIYCHKHSGGKWKWKL
jgi:hypothetical protein